ECELETRLVPYRNQAPHASSAVWMRRRKFSLMLARWMKRGAGEVIVGPPLVICGADIIWAARGVAGSAKIIRLEGSRAKESDVLGMAHPRHHAILQRTLIGSCGLREVLVACTEDQSGIALQAIYFIQFNRRGGRFRQANGLASCRERGAVAGSRATGV